MKQKIETEISSKDQELINYSFEVLLVNILFQKKEITEDEYKKLKIIIEEKYLNSHMRDSKVML